MNKHDDDCACRECFRADTYVCPRTLWGAPLVDAPEEPSLWEEIGVGIWNLLALIGMFAVMMALLGYMWATYIPERTCKPTLFDRALP